MKREVRSSNAPAPIGPYSQAVESGAVYCSGQVGINQATGSLEEGIVAQTRRALSNLEEVLKAAGVGMEDVAKTTVFMADLSEFSLMNDEYARHFSAPFPARSAVQVAALPKGARVEIDATALRK
ncbi:MAG TPA: Rid family detoxifying hydrolase [Nitrososphaerales archaeon]|nr:Rid family detoxifying hydrolase [Nitrososphaerales archaeon]